LVGCLSSDPRGVRYIVNRIERERKTPLLPELKERLITESDPAFPDRGWYKGLRSGGFRVHDLKYELNMRSPDRVDGVIRGEWGKRLEKYGLDRSKFDIREFGGDEGLHSILGGAPCAFAMAPFAAIAPMLYELNAPDGLKIAGQILQSGITEKSFVFASLFGGRYRGRILGMAVPTVVVGVQVGGRTGFLDTLTGELDKLNARYRWALIPRRMEVDGNSFVVLDRARRGVYDTLGSTGKPAFVEKQGWLLFASDMAALRKILARDEEGLNRWQAGIGSRHATAYAWMDPETTGKALKNAIAVYSLYLMVQNAQAGTSHLETIGKIGAWIDALQPGSCLFWLDADDRGFELNVEMGK